MKILEALENFQVALAKEGLDTDMRIYVSSHSFENYCIVVQTYFKYQESVVDGWRTIKRDELVINTNYGKITLIDDGKK